MEMYIRERLVSRVIFRLLAYAPGYLEKPLTEMRKTLDRSCKSKTKLVQNVKVLYITDFRVLFIRQIFTKYLEGAATVLTAGNISRIKLFYRE